MQKENCRFALNALGVVISKDSELSLRIRFYLREEDHRSRLSEKQRLLPSLISPSNQILSHALHSQSSANLIEDKLLQRWISLHRALGRKHRVLYVVLLIFMNLMNSVWRSVAANTAITQFVALVRGALSFTHCRT